MQIKNILFLIAICFQNLYGSIFVINPSENMRFVYTEYEKNKAYLYAETVAQYFYTQSDSLEIILTRTISETLEPLEAVLFSNKINPDLHISLHFFSSKEPVVYIYYYASEKNENISKQEESLTFIPACNAYKKAFEESKQYAHDAYIFLSEKTLGSTKIHSPIGCFFKPLDGITSPAFALEIGLPPEHHNELYETLLIDLCAFLTKKNNGDVSTLTTETTV